MSTTLLLDSSATEKDRANFSINYIPPIQLDKQYEIGLISCTAWHSMANVKTGINDEFTFNPGAWVTLKIPQGAYNVTGLNKTIRELITKNGGVADSFELTPTYNTLRARITLKNNLIIDFSSATSIASLIGFTYKHYGSVAEQTITYDGDLPVNITDVNTVLINCSVATKSYSARGSQGQTIYSFSPEVPPGSLMQISPSQVIYFPLDVENQITEINVQLTDQSGRQLDLNNEIVTYYLHVRAQ